jgi:hypothetical protein
LERDPERVRRDVEDGFVSAERAREDYGVIIDPVTREVDQASTEALRRAVAGEGSLPAQGERKEGLPKRA